MDKQGRVRCCICKKKLSMFKACAVINSGLKYYPTERNAFIHPGKCFDEYLKIIRCVVRKGEVKHLFRR